jgi:phosphoglycolate phosphatase-like HAD superfamily hydrolase
MTVQPALTAGADKTLAALTAKPKLVQTVLTGNLRAVAAIKLEVFDLKRYLNLDVGAYGDDDTDRPKLVAIAQQRATAKYGTIFDVRTPS